MSYTTNTYREYNFLDNPKFTDIKKREGYCLDGDILYQDSFNDINKVEKEVFEDKNNFNPNWLYEFKIEGENYKEIIVEKKYYNGNRTEYIVDYISNDINPVIKDTMTSCENHVKETYILCGGGCPKCNKYNFSIYSKDEGVCNECGYTDIESAFFEE